MPQLVKHFFKQNPGTYGLFESQMRGNYGDGDTNQWCHNAGWYNRAGEKVGWGDLSPGDFRRLRDELDEGECFVVISESASYWDLARDCPDLKDPYAPGTEYVAGCARYIITKGRVYAAGYDTTNSDSKSGTSREQARILLEFRTAEQMLAILKET